MDYRILAESMMELQAKLHQVPMRKNLSVLERGTFFLLNFLLLCENAVHPKDLSRGMEVSSARIAAMLNQLEERGLLQRGPDPHDNRQILVSLTEKGRQLILQKRAEIVDIVAQTLEELGPEDAQALLRIQERIVQNFQRHILEGPKQNCEDGKELTVSPP